MYFIFQEIIIFLLGVVLSLSYAHPVDKINVAISPKQALNPIQNPVKEILIPAQTMFRRGNWKSGVGLGNYGSGYAGLGGYPGYGGYGGYAAGYSGGYAGGYQPGSYGWRTG